MTPIKLIRKFGKLVRGGAGPKQIFLGCLLGVLIGMIPGFNLTLVLGILLLVILNANGGLAALGLVIGKSLCLLLAPLTCRIGYAIIHNIGLEGFFRAASGAPVLALLDLHVYCLVGGLPVAAAVGCVLGWLVTRSITGLRTRIVNAATRSEKVDRLARSKPARLLLRIAFGKQKKSLAELAERKDPLFRKSGSILAVVLVVVALIVELVAINPVFRHLVEAGMGSAVGAEVNVARAKVSIFGGELAMEGIEVTDPDKPSHNMIYIEKLRGDLSVSDLLAKRFVIDKLEVTAARTDTPRSSPGEVYRKAEEERPEDLEEQPEDAVARYVELGKDLRKYEEYAKKIREYLKQRKAETQPEKREEVRKERLAEDARKRGYLALSARELLARRPAWTIRELVVGKITVKKDGDEFMVEGRELSSNPALNVRPMSIRVAGSGGFDGRVAFDFSTPEGSHSVNVHAPAVPVGRAISLSEKSPVSVADGQADIDLDGAFNAESIDLDVVLNVKGLEADAREGKKVLGLDPETAREVFAGLSELEIAATIEGSIDSPRLKLDEKQLLASLKDSLVRAGKARLASRANEELEKLQGKAAGEIQKAIEEKLPAELKEVIPEGLGTLLPGKDSKDDEKEETQEEEGEPKEDLEEKAKDVLKKLF